MTAELMSEKSDFWDFQLADPKGALYIDGVHYRLGSATKPQPYNGMGGSWFTIRMLDSGTVIKTCDLWHQGDIPAIYNIKDNAEFIK